MKTKLYELILPQNSLSVFWIKDNMVYHVQDTRYPYPFDDNWSNVKWSSKNGYERLYPKVNRKYDDKFTVPLYAIDDDVSELKIFAQEAVDWKESQTSLFPESNNIVIVHKKIANDMRLIGYFVTPAQTDRLIHWLD